MRIDEVNKIFRRGIVKIYFETELIKVGYKRSEVKHPTINEEGFTKNNLLHIFFDLDSGSDYQDGDEWFIVEYLLPYNIILPDHLKGKDYFSTLVVNENICWRHRELIRYKYGKSKRIEEALRFIINKDEELYNVLKEASVTTKIEDKGN